MITVMVLYLEKGKAQRLPRSLTIPNFLLKQNVHCFIINAKQMQNIEISALNLSLIFVNLTRLAWGRVRKAQYNYYVKHDKN